MTDAQPTDAQPTGALTRQIQDLQSGTTSAVALVDAALALAEQRQSELHAFVRLRPGSSSEAEQADAARARGDQRTLLGVPLAVKDSHAIAGEPAPADGTAARTTVADLDDPWVALLRAAGAIVIGQTTMPPLALFPWGPARNPADPSRRAGGSSSGSAAAVAAGIVGVATASDGGGSIRIPAALCGLFGFKPAQGLLPGHGGWNGLSTPGVLTETAQDTAIVLDATGTPCEATSWTAAVAAIPSRLRIGWTDKPATPAGRPTREVVAALATAVTILRAQGHWVDPVSLRLSDAAPALSARLLSGAADDLAGLRARTGQLKLDQPARLMTDLGARVPAAAIDWALRRGDTIRQRMRALPFDVLLMPAVPAPALPQDDLRLRRPAAVLSAIAGASWTGAWNVAGLPAASIPLGRTQAGLPLAVQIVDLRGDGSVAFSLARVLAARD